MICTTEAGGESVNLSAANHAFFLDESYTPSETDQAKGRLLRRGQKKFVHINYLQAKDSLDEFISKYVHRKRLIIKIAEDGYPLLEEEKKILERNGGIIEDYFLQGGTSIDTRKAVIENLDFFETAQHEPKKRKKETHFGTVAYSEPTRVQQLLNIIARNPQDCWSDPDFAKSYTELLHQMSVIPIHQARIVEMMKYAKSGKIQFPTKILSDGSGPSILYDSYQGLEKLVKKEGHTLPLIVDRDIHKTMLTGKNPLKLLGNMNGKESAIKDSSFDFVDNSSISLLPNAQELKETLLESNRILKKDGVLSLCVQSYNFADSFYDCMKKLGFEVLTEPNQGIKLSTSAKRKLEKQQGKHYAEAYSRKLNQARIVIAKKISEPTQDVDPQDLWFEKEETTEKEEVAETDHETNKKIGSRRITTIRDRNGRISDVREK
jgi:hypothetical protein